MSAQMPADQVTHINVSTKSEADPSTSFADAPFSDSVDVLLLLEHFRIFRHIFWRVERIKVSDIELRVEHGHEGRGSVAQLAKLEALVKWHRLNILDVGYSVSGMCDESAVISIRSRS